MFCSIILTSSPFQTEICAIISFAVFIAVVQDQIEIDSSQWEYGYSFILFTVGWSFSCIIGPCSYGLLFTDDDD